MLFSLPFILAARPPTLNIWPRVDVPGNGEETYATCPDTPDIVCFRPYKLRTVVAILSHRKLEQALFIEAKRELIGNPRIVFLPRLEPDST